MAKQEDFDLIVLFSEEDGRGEIVDRELKLVSTFLPDILKQMVMLQEQYEED